MAESSVAFLLKHLSELLAHEAKLLCGVEDRIRSLHNELEIINVFLKTSMANKKSKREIEQKVVSQIRDVAHVAEDVIDTFVANVAIHKRRSMLARMLHVVDHTKSLRDIAMKIDNIKNTLKEIRENKINYDFQESIDREEEERAQSLHRLRRNVEEEDVVGFVHESKVVIERLMEGGSGSRRKVVSIIGMGGLGKTTLARKVYNNDEVKRHFNCRAWAYVSNECRARELLLGLLKQLMPNREYAYRRKNNKKGKKQSEAAYNIVDFSSLSDDELKKIVRGYLEGKRYLLVLDDLWKKQDWDEVQDAFPDENKGSRILITTRLKDVISHASRDPPYYLQFLSEEQSWELFSKKLFGGEEYPSDLDQLGRQLVRSCGGLPLSIMVLTGLLANKEKSHREWSKVVGHVNWYLTRDETQVKDIILKLSYEDLPARLKPCFLYLGIFPEDYEIPVKRLLQQWVAEEFIQETGNRDPYDVAEDYLYELIDRSLIRVGRLKSSGGVKTCRIHDLLRDLCISKGEEEKVFHVFTDNNILIPTKPRRLSIHCSMPRYVSSSTNDHSCVRSLFSFDPAGYFGARNNWKWLSKGFKLARVLDIQGKCCKKIPSNLGNFIHLRYLRINLEEGRSIPDSICNLSNLETLDLGLSLRHRPPPISFPNEIWKLKHLRHVYTYGPIMLRGHCSESDGEIVGNLQTISSVVLNKQMISLIEKGRFPQLRKLGLKIPPKFKGDLRKMLLGLQQLRHLNKLEIHFQINWPDFFNCKRQEVLQSLKRLSHLCALEIWHVMDLTKCVAMFPPNITKLILLGISFLDGDVMHALGSLSNLRILRLSSSEFSYSFDLNCVGGEFPQLLLFEMKNLPVQNWKLANGAMPCLQSLVIEGCKSLDSLPSELWSLTTLRKVHVLRPSNAMTTMLLNLEVKNGCEIIVDSYWDKIPLF